MSGAENVSRPLSSPLPDKNAGTPAKLASEHHLRIGDIVLLIAENRDNFDDSNEKYRNERYVVSGGNSQFEDSCFVQPLPSDHPGQPRDVRQGLFRILPCLQYSALTELCTRLKQLNANMVDANSMEDAEVTELKAAFEVETGFNKKNTKRHRGDPIAFGQSFQLEHVASGHFLTLCAEQLAPVATDCLKVHCAEIGSPLSWLEVQAPHRVRSHGDYIEDGDEVHLRFRQQDKEDILHVSGFTSNLGEVNSSNKSTVFKMVLFRRPSRTCLTSATVMRLVHVQSRSYLSYEHVNDDEADAGDAEAVSGEVVLTSKDYGNGAKSSDTLWVLDSADPERLAVPKGMCTWTDTFFFRHFNSGCFLSVRQGIEEIASPRSFGQQTVTVSTGTADDGDSIRFQLRAASQKTEHEDEQSVQIPLASNLLLNNSNQWLKSGEPLTDDLKVHSVEMSGVRNTHEFFRMELVSEDFVADAQACFGLVSAFKQTTKECMGAGTPSEAQMEALIEAAGSLVYFCLRREDSETPLGSINGISLKARQVQAMNEFLYERDAARQRLLREQGALTLAFGVLKRLVHEIETYCAEDDGDGSGRRDHLMSLSDFKLRPAWKKRRLDARTPSMEERAGVERAHVHMLLTARVLYAVVTASFADNQENRSYTAKWMDQIISHVHLNIGAGDCLARMLTNNAQLLSKKVSQSHVEQFIGLIREHGVMPMGLKFLRVLCCANDEAVPSMQDMVCKLLRLPCNQDILFRTRLSTDSQLIDSSPYLPRPSVVRLYTEDEEVDESCTDGILEANCTKYRKREIEVTWASWSKHGPTSTPQALFGKEWVSLHTIVEAAMNRDQKNHGLYERVCKYFLYQLRLFSTLCFDRNYLGIFWLQEQFTYELLLHGLADVHSSPKVREMFARLLDSLWVDRAPQREIAIPQLTRAWTNDNQLTYQRLSTRPSNITRFGLLQCVLYHYLAKVDKVQRSVLIGHTVKSSRVSKLTVQMCSLLHKLSSFGFYDTLSKLLQPAGMLLQLLDGRTDRITDPQQLDFRSSSGGFTLRRTVTHAFKLARSRSLISRTSRRRRTIRRTGAVDEKNLALSTRRKRAAARTKKYIKKMTAHTGYMVFVLACVPLSLLTALVRTIFPWISSVLSVWIGLFAVDTLFMLIFGTDVVLRWYVMGTIGFIEDLLCIADLIVTCMDIVGFAVAIHEFATGAWNVNDEEALVSAAGFTPVLRLFRGVRAIKIATRGMRVLRTMRAFSLAKQILARGDHFVVTDPVPASNPRYAKTDFNDHIILVKIHVIKLLEQFMLLSEDFRMSQYLSFFQLDLNERTRDDSTDSVTLADKEIEARFQDRFKEVKKFRDESKKKKKTKRTAMVVPAGATVGMGMFYDATTLWEAVENKQFGVEDVDAMLLDLLVYQSAELVQEALALLTSRHCQRQRMLTTLMNTQLLVFTDTCNRLDASMELLVQLERDFEEYESWSLQPNAEQKYAAVEEGLQELSELCDAGGYQIQNALKNHRVLNLIDCALDIPEVPGLKDSDLPDWWWVEGPGPEDCVACISVKVAADRARPTTGAPLSVVLEPGAQPVSSRSLGASPPHHPADRRRRSTMLRKRTRQIIPATDEQNAQQVMSLWKESTRSMRSVATVLKVFHNSAKETKVEGVDDVVLTESRRRRMLSCLNRLLLSLCSCDNAANQDLLEGIVGNFIDSIGLIEHSDFVVASIFHNNLSACEAIDGGIFEQLQERFFQCCSSGRVSYGCVHAFVNLVVCDGVPLKSNQARVVQVFKDALHRDVTGYMLCDQPERLPYRARRAAMAAMEDGADWDPQYIKVDKAMRLPKGSRPSSAIPEMRVVADGDVIVDGTDLLKTSMVTLRLLISCCFGDFTLAKQKCQNIFPLDRLLTALLDNVAAWNLRAMLLHLFSTLYIHSATVTRELVRMPRMRQLLQCMANLINEYVDMGSRRPDLVVTLSSKLKGNMADGMDEYIYGSTEHDFDPLRCEIIFNLSKHPNFFVRLVVYQVLPLVSSFLGKYGMQLLASDSAGGDVKATMASLLDAVTRLFNASKVVAVGVNKSAEAKHEGDASKSVKGRAWRDIGRQMRFSTATRLIHFSTLRCLNSFYRVHAYLSWAEVDPSRALPPHDFSRARHFKFSDEPKLPDPEADKHSWRKDARHIVWPGLALSKSHHAMDEHDQTAAAQRIIAELQRKGKVEVKIDRTEVNMQLSVRSLNVEQVNREWQHRMFSVSAGRLLSLPGVQEDIRVEYENMLRRIMVLPGGKAMSGTETVDEKALAQAVANLGMDDDDGGDLDDTMTPEAESKGSVAELCFPNVVARMVQIVRDNVKPSRRERFAKKVLKGTGSAVPRVVRILKMLINLQTKTNTKKENLRQRNIQAMQEQIFLVGGLKMVIDLIAVGIPRPLMLTAIKFGITLLKRKGGYKKAQQEARTYLESGQLTSFFVGVEDQLNWSAGQVTLRSVRINSEKAMRRQQSRDALPQDEDEAVKTLFGGDEDDEDVSNLHLLQFLHLLCLGNFTPNQVLLQSQPNTEHSVNICEALARYLGVVAEHISVDPQNMKAANAIVRLMHGLVAGPCSYNQNYLACDTDLLDDSNRMIRHVIDQTEKLYMSNNPAAQNHLKDLASFEAQFLGLIAALIEGWGEGENVVHDRLLAVFKFDTLTQRLGSLVFHLKEEGMLNASSRMPYRGNDAAGLESWKRAQSNIRLGSDIVALLLILGDYDPYWFRDIELTYRKEIRFFRSRMKEIEVRWRSRVHKVHFLVPNACMFRNASSQKEAMENIDGYNHADKLLEFMRVSAVLYKEMQNSRNLFKLYLNTVINLLWLRRSEVVAFYLGVFVNVCFFWVLQLKEGTMTISVGDTVLADLVGSGGDCTVRWILGAISLFLCLVTAFRLMSRLTLTGPIVLFKTKSWVKTLFNSQILLPFFYFTLVLIGCINLLRREVLPCALYGEQRLDELEEQSKTALLPIHFAWFSITLIDMRNQFASVKQATFTMWVALPPFLGTLFFVFLLTFAFSFFLFELFPSVAQIHPNHRGCQDLWVCTVYTMFTGPRLSGGVADSFNHYEPFAVSGYQWEVLQAFSFLYFLLVNLICLNILLGIMIDTFAQIRSKTERRREAAAGSCFICGIERRRFELSRTTTFKEHRDKCHNITAYIDYFVHIHEKPFDDLNGIEAHVLRSIEENMIDWFPLEFAGDLDNNEGQEDDEPERRRVPLHA